MKVTFLFLVVVKAAVAFSCPPTPYLDSDKNLREVFTEGEIKEIEKMVAYVDSTVLSLTKEEDINSAYHAYLNRTNQQLRDSSKFLVPFEEEEKYRFFESLDSVVFNEFWHINDKVKMVYYKSTEYRDLEGFKTLSLKPVGRYMEYLKKTGEEDEFYKSIHENIDIAGDVSASAVAAFAMNHQHLDFDVPKNRLWAAVYLLRIEENINVKMERWLEQKNSTK